MYSVHFKAMSIETLTVWGMICWKLKTNKPQNPNNHQNILSKLPHYHAEYITHEKCTTVSIHSSAVRPTSKCLISFVLQVQKKYSEIHKKHFNLELVSSIKHTNILSIKQVEMLHIFIKKKKKLFPPIPMLLWGGQSSSNYQEGPNDLITFC